MYIYIYIYGYENICIYPLGAPYERFSLSNLANIFMCHKEKILLTVIL